MYVRAVRFTDVSPERVEQLVARIDEADGPPPGVPTIGLQLLFDNAQATAVVLQLFDTAEDMRKGAEALGAMDPADTPGTRVSVDMCELKLDRRVSGRLDQPPVDHVVGSGDVRDAIGREHRD